MSPSVAPTVIDDAAREQLYRLCRGGGRSLLGVVGPPGAGKSTLVDDLVAQAGVRAAVVPMDGFHLADAELDRLGRRQRKGAADTFDAFGYLALLRRLRTAAPDETVYAPAFHRTLEEPIAGAIPIPPDVRLIITEGNYLLRGDPPWDAIRAVLDACWYLDIDDSLRQRRLIERHRRFGASEADASQWVRLVDEPNAREVIGDRHRADSVLRWSENAERFELAGG